MAKKRNSFSRGELKSRGWSNQLIKELLPPPRFVRAGKHSAALWYREDVFAAEDTERFRLAAGAIREEPSASGGYADTAAALAAAEAFLTEAWAAGERPEGPAALLAEKYHLGILKKLPGTAWADRLKPGQAVGR